MEILRGKPGKLLHSQHSPSLLRPGHMNAAPPPCSGHDSPRCHFPADGSQLPIPAASCPCWGCEAPVPLPCRQHWGCRLQAPGTALAVLQLQGWHSPTAACVCFWNILRVYSRFVLKISTFTYQSKLQGLETSWNNAYFIPEADGTMPLMCLWTPSCASCSLSLPASALTVTHPSSVGSSQLVTAGLIMKDIQRFTRPFLHVIPQCFNLNLFQMISGVCDQVTLSCSIV